MYIAKILLISCVMTAVLWVTVKVMLGSMDGNEKTRAILYNKFPTRVVVSIVLLLVFVLIAVVYFIAFVITM